LVAQIADSFVVSLLVFEMESSLLQGPLHVLSRRPPEEINVTQEINSSSFTPPSLLTINTLRSFYDT